MCGICISKNLEKFLTTQEDFVKFSEEMCSCHCFASIFKQQTTNLLWDLCVQKTRRTNPQQCFSVVQKYNLLPIIKFYFLSLYFTFFSFRCRYCYHLAKLYLCILSCFIFECSADSFAMISEVIQQVFYVFVSLNT